MAINDKSSVSWIPTILMLGASLISYLDRNALAVLAPTILRDTGISALEYGFAVSCFSMAYMVANPLWGFIIDRRGVRVGMSLAVALWSLAAVAHAFVGLSLWMAVPLQLAAARLMLGFAEGATFPGAMRTSAVTLPTTKQARGISIGYSGGSLGAILTPLFVTPIALSYGWRSAFWTTGAIGLLWVATWWFVSKPYPTLEQKREQTTASSSIRVSDPRLWAFLCLYGFGAIPLAVGLYAAPLYLSKVLGMSQATLGKLLWLPPLGWEAGYLFWGWIADRSKGSLGMAAAVLAVGSCTLAMIPVVNGLGPVLALFFVAMFMAGGFVILSLKYGLGIYPKDQAMVAGLGAGAWGGLVALLMPLVGSRFDAGHYAVVFVGVAIMPAVGTILWMLLKSIPSASRLGVKNETREA